MNSSDILDRLTSVSVWTSGDRRAPHKPLLLLLALARCSRGEPREIPYREVDQKLGALLREFGPPSKSYHPEYPFWRLQNDGIWLVRDADNLALRTGHSDVRKSELLRTNVPGGLSPEIYTALQKDHRLLVEVAAAILDAHFPALCMVTSCPQWDWSWSERLRLEPSATRHSEKSSARLRAAMRRLRIRPAPRNRGCGPEAAHIMWHEAGGPDVECNGLALCTM
ncbi:MAG: hypothetical protein IPM94_12230, partial [bacterium]|nr:hypothetical protein [bacterium]